MCLTKSKSRFWQFHTYKYVLLVQKVDFDRTSAVMLVFLCHCLPCTVYLVYCYTGGEGRGGWSPSGLWSWSTPCSTWPSFPCFSGHISSWTALSTRGRITRCDQWCVGRTIGRSVCLSEPSVAIQARINRSPSLVWLYLRLRATSEAKQNKFKCRKACFPGTIFLEGLHLKLDFATLLYRPGYFFLSGWR